MIKNKSELKEGILQSIDNLSRIRETSQRIKKGLSGGGETVIKSDTNLQSAGNVTIDNTER